MKKSWTKTNSRKTWKFKLNMIYAVYLNNIKSYRNTVSAVEPISFILSQTSARHSMKINWRKFHLHHGQKPMFLYYKDFFINLHIYFSMHNRKIFFIWKYGIFLSTLIIIIRMWKMTKCFQRWKKNATSQKLQHKSSHSTQ